MKKQRFFLMENIILSLCSLFAISCSGIEEEASSYRNQFLINDFECRVLDGTKESLDTREAGLLGNVVMMKKYPMTKSDNVQIEEIECVTDSLGMPLAYLINYSNNHGYVVLSAQKSFYPIVAYSNEGTIHKEDESTEWLLIQEQCAHIAHSRYLPTDSLALIRTAWNRFEKNEKNAIPVKSSDLITVVSQAMAAWTAAGYTYYSLSDAYSHIPAYIYQDFVETASKEANSEYDYMINSFVLIRNIESVTQINPLMSTEWYQGTPYNNSCPLINGSHALVGCGAIAAGQIMKYHQWPISYNWNDMPNSLAYTNLETTLSSFLYNVGVAMQMNYGLTASSTSSYNIMMALEAFDYSTSSVQTHSVLNVISDLQGFRPVLEMGERMTPDNNIVGHAWVCDGFQREISYQEFSLQILSDVPPLSYIQASTSYFDNYLTSDSFHMKFNNGVASNGWHYETSSSNVYTLNRCDIYNIHPNN